MPEPTVAARRRAVVREAWSSRGMRRALAAYLLFNVVEWASYLALLVYAYADGGVAATSAIALAQLVPAAVLASPCAAWLTRLPVARALVVGYVAQTMTGAAVGATILVDLPFPVVAAAAALFSVAITLTRPVHQTLLPEISETTGQLTAGNAASGGVEAAATLGGPLAAGALIAVWEPGGVLVVMAGVASASAVLVLALARESSRDVAAPGHDGRALALLHEIARDPTSRLLSLLVAAEYALVGMMDILLVVLAFDLLALPESGPGWLNAAIGLGGLVGASLTFVLIGARRLTPALVLGAIAAGVPMVLAGVVTSLWSALALIGAAGAGKVFYDVVSRTLVQRLLPDRMLGAVFGVQESVMMAGLAAGSLLAPLLVEGMGTRVAFAVAGLVLPAAALVALPGLLRRDTAAQVPTDVFALLLGVPILAVLPPRVVERLARVSVTRRWPPGAVVVREGEPGSLFYVVGTGELTVSHGREEVRRLGRGDWFGELALLRDSARTATVTAVDHVTLYAVDRDSFLAALAATPRSRGIAQEHADEHYR